MADELDLRFWLAVSSGSQFCYVNMALSMMSSSIRMKAEMEKTKALLSHNREMAKYYKELHNE